MIYSAMGNTPALIVQITIKIILISLLFVNYFFTITLIDEIQFYLMLYLTYLLIVPPIITHFRPSVQIEQFEQPLRKKFVTAKDELDKAVASAADSPEDTMMYLRTAIDLSIKAKFGFDKISKMFNFILDAEKFNLPLPSYTFIYTIFNEGSKRIHDGKIPTPFEASQAIELVTNFIAALEKIEISPAFITDFKQKCSFVS